VKPLKINLSSFKKIAGDKNSSTFQHSAGHKITIAHHAVSALQRKQMEQMPMHKMAEGGDTNSTSAEDTPDQIAADAGSLSPNDVPPAAYSGPATPYWQNGRSIASTPEDLSDTTLDYEKGRSPAGASGSWDDSDRSPAATDPLALPGSAQTQQGMGQQLIPMQAQQEAFQEEQAANLEEAKALQAQGETETTANAAGSSYLLNALPTQADIVNDNKAKNDALFNAYQQKQIDPDHYWKSHSKIAAGIGMLLSGAGNKGQGPNGAYQAMQEGINRDIDAQKNAQVQAQNLWTMNRAALGSDIQANIATQNQMMTGLKYKIDQAAASAKGPLAWAKAHAANAKLDQEMALNNVKLGLLANTSDDTDPSTRLGNMIRFGLIPQDVAPKIAEEIKNRSDIVDIAPKIREAFNQAAYEVRPMTAGTHTSLTAFVPGMESPGQKNFEALINTTVKDKEETTRQAAFKSIQETMKPQFGDNDTNISRKGSTVENYLYSRADAPLAKAYGIDLDKYPKTRMKQVAPPPTDVGAATRNGVRYNRQIINGKVYMVPVK